MNAWFLVAGIALAAAMTLFFSTLTYSLRDFSRAKLTNLLERANLSRYAGSTVENASDLIFVTAVGRLFANILALIGVLRLLHDTAFSLGAQYLLAVLITAAIHLMFSVTIPHVIARHAAEPVIATFIRFLHGLRLAMLPVTKLMHAADFLVAKAATNAGDDEDREEKLEHEVEQEILSAVE
ncbi:MAG TPA: CNNM domain-containing protein, partial [Tepidisphaeraceae bacterium]|nr:CNNM domain-containing protein [Tepidisphaeraceae bacterium]